MKKLFLIFAALTFTASLATAKEIKTIKGAVESVDIAAKTLTVKEKDKEVTLNITDHTTIKEGKGKKDLADIKAGDRITARTTEESGKTVASAIWVSNGAAHKKQKVMKEEKK